MRTGEQAMRSRTVVSPTVLSSAALAVLLPALGIAAAAGSGKGAAPVSSPAPTATKRQSGMTNADVLALVAAKLDTDLIVAQIGRANEVSFDLSTVGLVSLKKQGVSDAVIKAMMAKQDAPSGSVAAAVVPAQPAAAPISAPAAGGKPSDDCKTNFTAKGNFFSGKKFDTWQQFPAVAPPEAFKRLLAVVVKEGWKIAAADKDLGTISATQEVSFSDGGKQVPMNILVESLAPSGSKVSITFSLTGGLMGGTGTVQKGFCKLMAGVEGTA